MRQTFFAEAIFLGRNVCDSRQGCVIVQARLNLQRANDKAMNQACFKRGDLAPIEFKDAFSNVGP
ncbi:MAG: hypothetical protein ACRC2B_23415 [Rubrivivax sp.]